MNRLEAVFALNDQFTMVMKKIIRSMNTGEEEMRKAEKAVDSFAKRNEYMKTSANIGADGISTLTSKIGGLVSFAYLAKKALDGMFSAINTSALQKIQETTFGALLKDKELGSDLYAYVGNYAKTSALGRGDISKGVTSFLSSTRDLDQIEQLIKMTERLNAKDPSQGAEGAVFALKEALSGDVISLRTRYGITGLSGESLREGDTTSKLEQIDQALNKFGATQDVVDENFNNILTQSNMFATNLKDAIGFKAQPVMERLANTMMHLNEQMEAGKYEPFINLMVNGMKVIGEVIVWLGDNLNWIVPVLGGVVLGIIAYKSAMAIATIVTTVMGVALNAVAGNWIAAGATIVGVTAAIGLATSAMKEMEKSMPAIDQSFNTDNLAERLAGTGAVVPVEISNTSPIKVTGEVDIETENIKHMLDMAGQKFFAQYSHNTIVPQQQINMNVTKTADADEVLTIIADGLNDMNEVQPNGIYE